MVGGSTLTDEPVPGREHPRVDHVSALDGVRAVGVVLVFLFHLGVSGFDAGFLGVDIFFVLSGFLITSLLLNEMRTTGRVGLAGFWARRIRRLMPALVVLLLVVAVVSGLTSSFTERQSIRGDLLATTTYMSNWRFISTGNYFENSGVESPLQHTWSLGIEEQFYVLWPLLLALLIPVLKRPRLTVAIPAIVGAILSAVALAMLWRPDFFDRAYMGTDARLFEPLIGAAAAVVISGPGARGIVERAGTMLAAVGSVGMVVLFALIRPETALYYQGGAVAVSIFTAMVIASLWVGRGGGLRRILERRPVVFLGVISYGVYLWHWPFILWLGVRQRHGADLFIRSILAVALTIAVSTLSFYLIERPIRRDVRTDRNRVGTVRRRPIVALALVPLVMVSVIGVSLAATYVPPPEPGVPVIMLVGDSVPHRLESAIDRDTVARGWRLVSAAKGACSVTGELALSPDGRPVFDARNCPGIPAAQDALVEQADPAVIVWWDRWSESSFVTAGGDPIRAGTARFWRLRSAALDDRVKHLTSRGARILFVGTEPLGTAALKSCSFDSCRVRRQFLIDHYADITSRWNSMLERYARTHPSIATFASFTDLICRRDVAPCDDSIDGVPARPDGTHYEGAGEEIVVDALAGFIAPILAGDVV